MINWVLLSETPPVEGQRVMCSGRGWVEPDCVVKGGLFRKRVDTSLAGDAGYKEKWKDEKGKDLPLNRCPWGSTVFPTHWAAFPEPAVGVPYWSTLDQSDGPHVAPAPLEPPQPLTPVGKPKTLDKESIGLLQRIDKNCNDCAHLKRRFGPDAIAAPNMFYGDCALRGAQVTFVPATCMHSDNHGCFVHRKDLN